MLRSKTIKPKVQVNRLFEKLRTADTRFVLSYGGAGSGKSHTQAQYELINGMARKEKVLILRKVKDTLKDSVIPLMNEEILPAMKAGSLFTYHATNRVLTCKLTGTQYLFRGLDDPEKIKSIAGITRIWLEEASEFNEADFNQLNLRLRAQGRLQMVLTFNPIDESHWLKKRFFDFEDPDATIIKSTFQDNPFLPESYVNELLKYKKTDYNYFRVYALGDWGKLDSGAELYKAFDPAYNVDLSPYDPDLPLHISFDENVNPYMSASLWQGEGLKVRQVDEITLSSPRNNIKDVCTEFIKRYRGHGSGLVIYGDATSKKSDAKLERGYNFYNLVRDYLADYHPQFKVPSYNPSVMMRALFINEIWRGHIEGPEILIGENCPKTIEDFKYTKEASDGTKLKEKVTDPVTKVRYEPYGHLTDTAEYFICEYFKKEFRSFQRGPSKSVNYLAGKKKLSSRY